MAVSRLETTDIFRGAFLLCMGGDLEAIRMSGRGRQLASFRFAGPDLHDHDRAYINGQALVNPVQFREALNLLRDRLFRTLRHHETRYDRSRRHRPHQGDLRP